MKNNYVLLTIILLISLFTDLSAQNINTTFRSKMTFPGQTLANVWSYTAGGHEYALAGGALGLIIVDITNPDLPQQIVQIPGPNSLWKEIKTYSHYAYVVSEGGLGIQVVDLSNLPSASLPYHYYQGDGAILNQLNKIHALHIDTTKGFLYAYGGDLFSGAAKVFDLKQDPYNPVYVGNYMQLGYIHDGYVDNDTMYACHIYAGYFSIVNMADKANPALINTQTTPNSFPHNTWISEDHKTIFSTDERPNTFLAAFDISDPLDIKFLDKIQSNPGSQSIVHNTQIRHNFAITSWYKDGFTIVDVTRPDNLVQVGNYDTYPGASGSGFEGDWGVCPYFPSGTIVASNINAQGTGNGELFIITPNYVRACYLEGSVKDAVTGAIIPNASVQILNTNFVETTNQLGQFKMGQLDSGFVSVRISQSGYQNYEGIVALHHGQVTLLNAELFPEGSLTVSGNVYKHVKHRVVEGATVWLYGIQTYSGITAANGTFSIPNVEPGLYTVAVSDQLSGAALIPGNRIVTDTSLQIELFYPYRKPPGMRMERGDTDLTEMVASPNPFTVETNVTIPTERAGLSLRVMDVTGKTIETISELPETESINLGKTWAKGVYFVQILQHEQVVSVTKMVKQ
ncbi:MAG: choice-of-anchor B family protein [Bacteroidota bacterium]